MFKEFVLDSDINSGIRVRKETSDITYLCLLSIIDALRGHIIN